MVSSKALFDILLPDILMDSKYFQHTILLLDLQKIERQISSAFF